MKGMTEQEWEKRTHFPNWTVKDILAHLLDTSIRRLSSQRDKYQASKKINIDSYQGLVQYVTDIADRWTDTFADVSPKILTEMIEKYQNELVTFFSSLEPLAQAHYPVNWAGETASANWFDIAREYTERWHHQMQIREALGREPLYSKDLYYPVIDTFMQALPFHFRKTERENGNILGVEITGDSGGTWFLEWKDKNIKLRYDIDKEPDTLVSIKQEIAWKIFTKWNTLSLDKEFSISGDKELGQHLLSMTCILMS